MDPLINVLFAVLYVTALIAFLLLSPKIPLFDVKTPS
jgi:hypothetical protein